MTGTWWVEAGVLGFPRIQGSPHSKELMCQAGGLLVGKMLVLQDHALSVVSGPTKECWMWCTLLISALGRWRRADPQG